MKCKERIIYIIAGNEDLKSVCNVASFYISIILPKAFNTHKDSLAHEFLFLLVNGSNFPMDFIWIAVCLLEKLHKMISISEESRIGSV